MPPANIVEFNTIVGLIFAQLYTHFPVVIDLDRQAIADSFGVKGNAWGDHKLPSGKAFADVFAGTLGWLKHENYIASFGVHPAERVMLTGKGLAALNATPDGLSATVGSSLVTATRGQAKLVERRRLGRRSDRRLHQEHGRLVENESAGPKRPRRWNI
jgi:hypothetical protein